MTSVQAHTTTKKSIIHRFTAWCHAQEKNRIEWLAIALVGHGCIITPLTLLFIMLTGNHMIFWPMAIAAISMTLVVNLAAQPTKVTIPVFFLGILIDLAVIINCIAIGFSSFANG